MLPTVLILLVVALFVGLGFIVLGWRGRRLNDHPVCSWCKFDLEGVYPECVTCPECGAGLKRDKAVRVGVRKRMPLVTLLGALVVLTSVLPVGVMAYAALTGTNINKHKPLGFLLWEANLADAARSQVVADEIMSRMLAGQLDPSQVDRVVAKALEFQADHSRPWVEGWGDLVDRAEFDGKLSEADRKRFIAQAPVFEVSTRPRVNAGSLVPVAVRLKESRVGSTSSIFCPVSIDSVSLAGKPLKKVERNESAFNPVSLLGEAGGLTLSGSNAPRRLGFGAPDSVVAMYELPEDAPTGKLKLDVGLLASPGEDPMIGARGFSVTIINGRIQQRATPPAPAPKNQTAYSTSTELSVLPKDEAAVEPKKVTEDEVAALTAKLRPMVLAREDMPGFGIAGAELGGPRYRLDFDCSNLPAEVSYDVFLRGPEGEVRLGEFASGKPIVTEFDPFASMSTSLAITINGRSTVRSSGGATGATRRSVSGVVPFRLGESVDVILRPSARAATSTLDQGSYADQPLEFKGVEVEQDPFEEMQRQMRQLRRSAPSGGRLSVPR